MSIRAAIDSDAAAIARIHIASWHAAYRGLVPDEILDRLDVTQRTAQWTANITDHAVHTIVDDLPGGISGFASFGSARDQEADPATVGEVHAIYVEPNEWGKGIGQRLCTAVVGELFVHGYNQITLWVLKENRRARRFYERAGFTLDGATKVEMIGTPLEAVRYRMRTHQLLALR